jgi:hypothetical protein
MLSDGIYGVEFAHSKRRNSKSPPDSEALAVFRGGTILGSDPWGGVFTGTYAQCPATGAYQFHVLLNMPPKGKLITGFAAGPDGAQVDIYAAFDAFVRAASSMVTLEGKPLHVTVSFLGPLPDSSCAKQLGRCIQQ